MNDPSQGQSATKPLTEPPAVLTAWPRSAQLALAFALGICAALLAVHTFGYLRWGSRPSELERGTELSYRIDLNRADRAELLQIPGMGENLAKRIEDYRLQHGRFRSVSELTQIHGIGPATLERWRSWVRVSPETTDEESETTRVAHKSSTQKKSSEVAEKDATSRKPNSRKADSLTTVIDINRATAAELQRLPGVGPKMSERILEERRKSPFKSVDDLRRVHGIGPKTLERLRPYVTVESDSNRVVKIDQES